ncbi:MAG: hypothetical protein KAH54_11660 [Candidatus Sabulitectum sp.]|nr:hypothetical protein [Candidatus Sabulitectum sp.]
MPDKSQVFLRLLGGVIFAGAVFFLIYPELGRNATVGIMIAMAGFRLVLKGEQIA